MKIFNIHHLAALFILAALPAASQAQNFRDAFNSVTPENFDSGGSISRQFHLHVPSYLESAVIARTKPARELPVATSSKLAQLQVQHRGGESSFRDYVAGDPLVDGVIVIHKGRIAFEAYPNMQPWERHFAWSVTKVVTSTVLGALASDGRLDMEKPVDVYVPELAGTAWEGTSVRNIANMASGMNCLDDDGYQVKTTCVYRMEETLGITAPAGYTVGFLDHIRGIQRKSAAGLANEYVSANTNVLMLVIEVVTGQSLAAAMQSFIWDKIGPEADALIAISDEGYAYASGGFTLRLRDMARFGQVFTQAGHFGVIDDALINDAQGDQGIKLSREDLEELAEELGEDLPVRAAWQWDYVWEDGALYKAGYLGQGLYVDPERELVIAWFGTGINFSDDINELMPIARQLAGSGLF